MSVKDTYPAALYEGGGHKLMLGLCYKFSLGEIIGNSPFLLIDEPTEFMDVENRVKLLSNLPSITNGTQILLITHQDVDKIHQYTVQPYMHLKHSDPDQIVEIRHYSEQVRRVSAAIR